MAFVPGTRVRTRCGGTEMGYWWDYGTVAVAVDCDHGNTEYRVNWDGGGYDYLCDFELEVVA